MAAFKLETSKYKIVDNGDMLGSAIALEAKDFAVFANKGANSEYRFKTVLNNAEVLYVVDTASKLVFTVRQ